ncbi:MAG: 3-deoxy-D-manno-octulosonic acid transferase [Bacteroidetes bacterium HGW-Bacteroidetes-21]|jgi:3-deoxy-D-manno-octulosonic-acid transferase|nr:MAG: 3-deoxy-D-manno-octulosonic acid transferase [Bacteroidetes bacterium HGW-Bacteroidetes-21]
MRLVYFLSILFYTWIIRAVSPFNHKAKLWITGRKDWRNKLKNQIKPGEKWIWFHCASLGEFEQGRPVVEKIKERNPGLKILLTFFSPSGYEVRKNYTGADYVCYLPEDFPANASFFVKTVKPEMVFFVKYEFWYFFISALHKSRIPVYLISAIFRPDQIFFRWYGAWYHKILRKYTRIFVQDEASENLLKQSGVTNVIRAGDTRFDRVWQIFQSKKEMDIATQFVDNQFVVVAGSTWKPDEEMICHWINKAAPEFKLIIAPHLIDEEHIQELKSMLKVPTMRYSEAAHVQPKDYKVLIIDNIGMLSSLYQYGQFAYVGGGFGVGLHNILEAAVYGIPVVFGPNYRKFSEAVQLIAQGGAYTVPDASTFECAFRELSTNHQARTDAGKKAGLFVQEHIGAIGVILENVKTELF